jgi:hypothetical protein
LVFIFRGARRAERWLMSNTSEVEPSLRPSSAAHLLAFVRARLNEEQMLAKLALDHPSEYDHALRERRRTGTDDGVWSADGHGSDACRITGTGITIYDEGGHNEKQAQFIAHHDPAQALRRVEAERKIVDRCAEVIAGYDAPGSLASDPVALAVTLAVDTVRSLASIREAHPDYRSLTIIDPP